jgi:hypothetical protein
MQRRLKRKSRIEQKQPNSTFFVSLEPVEFSLCASLAETEPESVFANPEPSKLMMFITQISSKPRNRDMPVCLSECSRLPIIRVAYL